MRGLLCWTGPTPPPTPECLHMGVAREGPDFSVCLHMGVAELQGKGLASAHERQRKEGCLSNSTPVLEASFLPSSEGRSTMHALGKDARNWQLQRGPRLPIAVLSAHSRHRPTKEQGEEEPGAPLAYLFSPAKRLQPSNKKRQQQQRRRLPKNREKRNQGPHLSICSRGHLSSCAPWLHISTHRKAGCQGEGVSEELAAGEARRCRGQAPVAAGLAARCGSGKQQEHRLALRRGAQNMMCTLNRPHLMRQRCTSSP